MMRSVFVTESIRRLKEAQLGIFLLPGHIEMTSRSHVWAK